MNIVNKNNILELLSLFNKDANISKDTMKTKREMLANEKNLNYSFNINTSSKDVIASYLKDFELYFFFQTKGKKTQVNVFKFY